MLPLFRFREYNLLRLLRAAKSRFIDRHVGARFLAISALTIKYALHPHPNPLLKGKGVLKRLH